MLCRVYVSFVISFKGRFLDRHVTFVLTAVMAESEDLSEDEMSEDEISSELWTESSPGKSELLLYCYATIACVMCCLICCLPA